MFYSSVALVGDESVIKDQRRLSRGGFELGSAGSAHCGVYHDVSGLVPVTASHLAASSDLYLNPPFPSLTSHSTTNMFINTLRIPLRTTPLVFRRNLSSAPSRLLNPCLTAKPSTSIALHYPKQTQIIVRSIASQVSGRPGSQTVEHAATNIKEELSNSSADLAKSIAGGNYFSDAVEPTQQTFVSIHEKT